MINISTEEIKNRMFFIHEEDSDHPIAVIKVGDLLEFNKPTGEMSEWIKRPTVSCETILRWRANVVECQCPKCKRWCVKWADTFDYEKCPHCGEDMSGGAE